MSGLKIRPAQPADAARLEAIRSAAFAPIFSSFRSILGDEIYERAQAHENEAQDRLLASMSDPESEWKLFAAERESQVVGFVSVRLDRDWSVGEIGLNAVDPSYANEGIGTAMYEFSVSHMKRAGMKVATVATGGDPSHAPARPAICGKEETSYPARNMATGFVTIRMGPSNITRISPTAS